MLANPYVQALMLVTIGWLANELRHERRHTTPAAGLAPARPGCRHLPAVIPAVTLASKTRLDHALESDPEDTLILRRLGQPALNPPAPDDTTGELVIGGRFPDSPEAIDVQPVAWHTERRLPTPTLYDPTRN